MSNPVTDIEERLAWDQYVASLLDKDVPQGDLADGYEAIAVEADKMLRRRRARFGSPDE